VLKGRRVNTSTIRSGASSFLSSEETPPELRERKQVVKHLIKKVLEPRGYRVERADDIDNPGQITLEGGLGPSGRR
jgi:hypothetical protein